MRYTRLSELIELSHVPAYAYLIASLVHRCVKKVGPAVAINIIQTNVCERYMPIRSVKSTVMQLLEEGMKVYDIFGYDRECGKYRIVIIAGVKHIYIITSSDKFTVKSKSLHVFNTQTAIKLIQRLCNALDRNKKRLKETP